LFVNCVTAVDGLEDSDDVCFGGKESSSKTLNDSVGFIFLLISSSKTFLKFEFALDKERRDGSERDIDVVLNEDDGFEEGKGDGDLSGEEKNCNGYGDKELERDEEWNSNEQ
jgi:hypothetical protein